MDTKPKRPAIILDLIGWNLVLLAFLCFLYVATVQKGVGMEILVPFGMIFGGVLFGYATKTMTTDWILSRRELHDGLLWLIVCFGVILTLNVGVVPQLSHAPFNISLAILPLKTYGILIAIAEEICFRGFLLPWWGIMSPKGWGVFLAVPFSAGAWALFHLGVYGTHPIACLLVAMVGVIVGAVTWFKKRLWICMGAHALVNFIAIGGYTPMGMLIMGGLVTLIVILWAWRRKR